MVWRCIRGSITKPCTGARSCRWARRGLGPLFALWVDVGQNGVGAAIGGAAQIAGFAPAAAREVAQLIGQRGRAVTVLRPSGQVEINGRRFEATVEVGAVDAGDIIVVRGQTAFALLVEKANP